MTGSRRFDMVQVRQLLRERIDALLPYLFPNGRTQGHTFVVGDVNGKPGDSLVIECAGERCGLWKDFATDEGGDLIDLWAAHHGLNAATQFPQILEQITAWLGMAATASVATTSVSQTAAAEVVAPKTQHWDYQAVDGSLIARVYRQDTPQGKEYRPWDAATHRYGMPSPRPLYRLPNIHSADTIVIVEGEKCADALLAIGYAATTAMGGANAPFDKTDWSPLAGKRVVLWPDNDAPGARHVDKLIERLPQIGVRELHRVTIPDDKPTKWDAADARFDGTDIEALIRSAKPVHGSNSQTILDWHAIDRFRGEPAKRQWLVTEIFPMAQASLVAASGGVGKSFMLLALARAVAGNNGQWLNLSMMFGSTVMAGGAAIYLTAEDDAIELHSRLNALGDIPKRLYVIPLPDAGGAQAYFAPESTTKAPGVTPAWNKLLEQLQAIDDIKLVVFDPLQPLCALDLNVPENAQFVCSRLAALAASTGASVIVSHHFAKREATTPEQAREAIRGTGGLVDGVRSVYALWQPREDDAKAILKQLELPRRRGAVVMGGVVKANGKANLKVVTYVRDDSGLLIDRTDDLRRLKTTPDDLLPMLRQAIADAAADGKPYTKTGVNGVHTRRFEMPCELHKLGKHAMAAMVDALLEAGDIVQALADRTKSVKWLDVPEGKLANGSAEFRAGHMRRRDIDAQPDSESLPQEDSDE